MARFMDIPEGVRLRIRAALFGSIWRQFRTFRAYGPSMSVARSRYFQVDWNMRRGRLQTASRLMYNFGVPRIGEYVSYRP